MTILVDLDDTLTNFLETLVKEVNRTYKTNTKYEDITSWNIAQFFPTLTEKQVWKVVNNSDFWAKIKPLYGAYRSLKYLVDDGHKVVIVTATHYKNVAVKYKQIIYKFFPFIEWKDVIITSQKEMIKGDMLIDDAVHNIKKSNHQYKLLFSAPHNRDVIDMEIGGLRVNNWDDVIDFVKYVEKFIESE